MTDAALLPAITESPADGCASSRRVAHQMAIDAGLPLDSPLLHSFDEAAVAADAQLDEQQLKALHRFIDDAFEHHVKTMAATPEAFQRLVLEAAQSPEGHRGH